MKRLLTLNQKIIRQLACVVTFILLAQTAWAQKISTEHQLRVALKELSAKIDDTTRIRLLLESGSYYLNKQGEISSDLGQASGFQSKSQQLATQIGDAKMVARSLILKADILRESGNKKQSWQVLEQAQAHARRHRLPNEVAMALVGMGHHLGNEGAELEQKMAYYKEARAMYRAAKNRLEEAHALKYIGEFYLLQGKGQESIKTLDTALYSYQKIGFQDLQGVYTTMSSTYSLLGDLSHAIESGLKALSIAEKQGNRDLQTSSIYNQLAVTYFYLGKDEAAVNYWEKARVIAEEQKNGGYLQTITANMAGALVRMKKYQQAINMLTAMVKKYPPTELQMKIRIPYALFNTYYDMGEYDKATPYFKELLHFHQSIGKDNPNQIYLYKSIIRKFVHDKKFAAAYPYLKVYDSLSNASGNAQLKAYGQHLWFKTDSAMGKPWEALKHFELYKRWSDSATNIEKSKQIANLEMAYGAAKKDHSISVLKQKSLVQQANIRDERHMRYAFTAGLLLLVVLTGLIYKSSRLKMKTNKKLELKQTEINAQNELLRRLLEEKEWLLKEIHHRVKNNLQIVISLLNTQSAYLENEDAIIAIRNSQNRMHAMSMIHQKLYQSDNLAEIDMQWYVRELVSYIRECFGPNRSVEFTVEAEAIKLDVAQAVPLGLILNEALSNALKYAFPDGKKGKVMVSFTIDANHLCTLVVADDGVGLKTDFEAGMNGSLGMSLMTGLSQQLDGTLTLRGQPGLTITLSFSKHSELTAYSRVDSSTIREI